MDLSHDCLGDAGASMRAVSKSELFSGLTGTECTALATRLRPRQFVPGEILLLQGQFSGELHLIQTGMVRVCHSDSLGVVNELAQLGPGQFIGEMSLLTGQPHSATVVAIMATESLVLARDDFLALLGSSPRLAQNLSRVLSVRLAHANQQRPNSDRTLVVAVACPELPACGPVLALNLAISLAMHSRRRTLLATDATAIFWPLEQTAIPSLVEVARGQGAVTAHHPTTLEHPALPGVSVCTLGTAGSLEGALEMLDHRYGQIVMAASDPGDLAWASGAKHCLIIASDAHSVPSAVTTTLRRVGQFGGQAGVIATGLHNAPSVGHLRSLGIRLGTHVLCGLTRPLFALAEEGLPPLIRRERGGGDAAAIGWLARHLLGCKVGLALGAGSARGFAHLGVLQVFEREGIPVDVLTGTSIGAIIAGAWATGMRIDTIARILHDAGSKLLAPTVPYASLFSNRNVRVALVRMVGETRIDDLPIPYAAVAVDLHTRSPVVLHEGFLRKAMLASAAIPGIFPPVLHEGHVLIDGALRNPLPTDVAADLGADRVIGVRLSPTPLGQVEAMATNATRKDSLLDVVLTMLDAMQEAIEASCGHNASLVIHPALAKVPLRQFNTGAALMETGARATEAALPTLRTLLPWLDRSRSPTFT